MTLPLSSLVRMFRRTKKSHRAAFSIAEEILIMVFEMVRALRKAAAARRTMSSDASLSPAPGAIKKEGAPKLTG